MISDDYIAGFFDGEGNVQIAKKGGTTKITITQKHRNILDLIVERFSFHDIHSVIYAGRSVKNPGVTYRLRIHRKDSVRRFIEIYQPLCQDKAADLSIGLELLDLPRKSSEMQRRAIIEKLRAVETRGHRQRK